MPDKTRMRDEHSCGGVVVSFREGAPFVAMIATRQKTRWGLPKGAVADGETPEQAALREVLEETGLQARIVKKLDTIEYFFRAGGALIRKRVDFFLMLYVAGDLTPQLTEVDDTAWFDLQEAIGRASFDSERKLLERTADEVAILTKQLTDEENQRVAR